MLTSEEYALAKAKLQDRIARRIGGEETERLAATVKEYEDFQESIPPATPELVKKHAKKAEKVAAGFAKAAKKPKKTK